MISGYSNTNYGFLRVILNTIMTVRFTTRKVENIQSITSQVLAKTKITIQELSELVGKLVSTFPGVTFCKLF